MEKQKQCAYWFLTINPTAECYKDIAVILDELVNNNPKMEYSYIYHSFKENDDSFNENHIHLVLYFKNAVKRFKTLQNLFCGAHIEMTNKQRYKRCIQYLIHYNDSSKHSYDVSQIITNLEYPYLCDILTGNGYDYEYFETYKLEEYLMDCFNTPNPSIFYFIKRFGLDAIKPYYYIIKDLIRDKIVVEKQININDAILYN